MVSRFANEKVLKAYCPEARVESTRNAVVLTRQAELSASVKAARRYDARSRELRSDKQTHTHTHTRNTSINIIDNYISSIIIITLIVLV